MSLRHLKKGHPHNGGQKAVICLCFVTMLATQAASSLRRTAPTIAGVHLGMISADVLRVLSTKGGLLRRSRKPCLADYLAQHRKVVSMNGTGNCLQSLETQFTGGGNLLVSFVEDLPRRPGVTIVNTISVNDPSERAVDQLLKRTGRPTFTDGKRPWIIAEWCFYEPCKDKNLTVSDPEAGPVMLVHRGAGFTLSDKALTSKSFSVVNAMLAARGVKLEP